LVSVSLIRFRGKELLLANTKAFARHFYFGHMALLRIDTKKLIVHLRLPYTNLGYEKKLKVYYEQSNKSRQSSEIVLPQRFKMLTETDVIAVLECHFKRMLQKDIAELLGFHYSTISRCLSKYNSDKIDP